MATTKQLIESAMRTIGVLAAGEEAKPSELQDALEYAKAMLDSWSNETLMVQAYTHESFTLTSTRSYTMGPGGAFDTVRPQHLVNMVIRDSGGLDTPVSITSLEQWASIPRKDTERHSPAYAYFVPEYPLARIEFSAITTPGDTLKLVSAKAIEALPELTAETTYPPGYDRAIRLGLAMELAPEYGKQVDQVLAAQLNQAVTVLKRTNARARIPTLEVDHGLTRRRAYDITHGPGAL
ncbi:MAG: hypothetical protein ACQES7_04315 [Pseudomonadota bacterium]